MLKVIVFVVLFSLINCTVHLTFMGKWFPIAKFLYQGSLANNCDMVEVYFGDSISCSCGGNISLPIMTITQSNLILRRNPVIVVNGDEDVTGILDSGCGCLRSENGVGSPVVLKKVNEDFFVLYEKEWIIMYTSVDPNSAVLFGRKVPNAAEFQTVQNMAVDLKNRKAKILCDLPK